MTFREQNRSRRYCARRADLRQKERVHTALNLLHLQDAKTKQSHGILQPGFQRPEVWHTDKDCIQISKFGPQFSLTLKVCWIVLSFILLFLFKMGCFQRWMLLPFTLHLGVPTPNCPNLRGSIMDQIVLSWRHPALFIYSSEVQRATGLSISRLMVTGYRIDLLPFNFFGNLFCRKGAIVGWQ